METFFHAPEEIARQKGRAEGCGHEPLRNIFRQQKEENDASRDEYGNSKDGRQMGERSNSKQIPKEGEKAVLGYFPIFPPVGGQGAAASP